jgi:hypothetical protein
MSELLSTSGTYNRLFAMLNKGRLVVRGDFIESTVKGAPQNCHIECFALADDYPNYGDTQIVKLLYDSPLDWREEWPVQKSLHVAVYELVPPQKVACPGFISHDVSRWGPAGREEWLSDDQLVFIRHGDLGEVARVGPTNPAITRQLTLLEHSLRSVKDMGVYVPPLDEAQILGRLVGLNHERLTTELRVRSHFTD